MVGMAGDFTRSLVNDPPRTLWTRQLKVSPSELPDSHGRFRNGDFPSSQVSRILPHSINAVLEYAPVPASALHCPPAFNRPIGEIPTVHPHAAGPILIILACTGT